MYVHHINIYSLIASERLVDFLLVLSFFQPQLISTTLQDYYRQQREQAEDDGYHGGEEAAPLALARGRVAAARPAPPAPAAVEEEEEPSMSHINNPRNWQTPVAGYRYVSGLLRRPKGNNKS